MVTPICTHAPQSAARAAVRCATAWTASGKTRLRRAMGMKRMKVKKAESDVSTMCLR